MYKLSSLLPNLGACFVMYFVGKNYQLKDGSTKLGLTCALIASISSFFNILFTGSKNILSYFSVNILRFIVFNKSLRIPVKEKLLTFNPF